MMRQLPALVLVPLMVLGYVFIVMLPYAASAPPGAEPETGHSNNTSPAPVHANQDDPQEVRASCQCLGDPWLCGAVRLNFWCALDDPPCCVDLAPLRDCFAFCGREANNCGWTPQQHLQCLMGCEYWHDIECPDNDIYPIMVASVFEIFADWGLVTEDFRMSFGHFVPCDLFD